MTALDENNNIQMRAALAPLRWRNKLIWMLALRRLLFHFQISISSLLSCVKVRCERV